MKMDGTIDHWLNKASRCDDGTPQNDQARRQNRVGPGQTTRNAQRMDDSNDNMFRGRFHSSYRVGRLRLSENAMHLETLVRRTSTSILIPMLLSVVCSAAPPEGTRYGYKQVDDRELAIYVTKPSDWRPSDRRPAIVFFHGGAWVGGAPGQFTEHSKYFASRGVVCFQVEYRLLQRQSNDPPTNCVEDATSAMRWVRARAEEFGIDPNRIASAGGSAGGHLAAFVGTVDHDDVEIDKSVSAKSNATLLFNPVYDNGPGGWGTARVGSRYPEFSPAHNLSKDDPPSIVFLGSEDDLIPVETAERFRDNCRKLGVDSELHVYEGQGHGFFNHGRDKNKWYVTTVTAADRFLNRLGWIEGEPTLELSVSN